VEPEPTALDSRPCCVLALPVPLACWPAVSLLRFELSQVVRAADGADDHDDGGDDDDDASARVIPRYPRDNGLLAIRRQLFLAGVAHRTGAVADRARIMRFFHLCCVQLWLLGTR